ncbi:MAG: hypothetical protein ACI9LO_002109 [Planctomycetota bacterium]|jgi:hypothetical protein
MSNNVQAQAIIMSLTPMFEKAEAENLWFYHDSKDSGEVWASPAYLRLMQSQGRLLWSPEHWELRNPMGYMKSLHRQAEELIAEYNEMAERLQIPNVLLLEKQDMAPQVETTS